MKQATLDGDEILPEGRIKKHKPWVRCPECNRMVGTEKNENKITVKAKHRTGRSTKKNVKSVCLGSGK